MKREIANLTDQITSALNDFADATSKDARRNYRQARSNVDSMMSDMSDRGYAMANDAYETAMSFEEDLENVIAQRPLAAVGIAVALGFVIGAAWRR